jgi:7-cyano-7-deazaguanine synthase
MTGPARPAVVLLSGGLDSATVLAMALDQGFAPHCLSFRYGQRHIHELVAAQRVADAAGVPLQVVDIDLRAFGGSALTDDVDVPKDRDEGEMAGGIPVTYVPARNTIFLSFALARAEVNGARDLFIGANAVDYSGYPDCRPAFIEAFEALANVATAAVDDPDDRYRVHAPLMTMSKADIVRAGNRLGVDYRLTWSCYDPQSTGDGDKACGRCDSCLLRHRGFLDAGVDDPTPYALAPKDA